MPRPRWGRSGHASQALNRSTSQDRRKPVIDASHVMATISPFIHASLMSGRLSKSSLTVIACQRSKPTLINCSLILYCFNYNTNIIVNIIPCKHKIPLCEYLHKKRNFCVKHIKLKKTLKNALFIINTIIYLCYQLTKKHLNMKTVTNNETIYLIISIAIALLIFGASIYLGTVLDI